MDNRRLHIAKENKADCWYTELSTISNELVHYRKHLYNADVLCPCDTLNSKFTEYFLKNFSDIGLHSLTVSAYSGGRSHTVHQWTRHGKQIRHRMLTISGDGSFDSPETLSLIRKASILVSNPLSP